MIASQHLQQPLLTDVRQLIDAARQRVAQAVNAELTQLYWQVGRRISTELLHGKRADYGKQVVAELARQLTTDFGKGWSEQQLRHCVRLADVLPQEQILSTLHRELTWSHLKTLIYIDDALEKHEQIEGESTPIGLILCTGKNTEHVELLQLPQSNIRVADYLTLLPPRETLQAKLHQSIELARQKLEPTSREHENTRKSASILPD